MKQYLMNLANIHAINFCKENKIDCSGSHIYKHPRKQTYALIRDTDGKSIVTVTFHKSSVPTYIYMNTKTMLDHESVCSLCDKIYDRTTESPEIKESGEYICPTCWDKDE